MGAVHLRGLALSKKKSPAEINRRALCFRVTGPFTITLTFQLLEGVYWQE
jgi:hypothetical protein